MKSIFAQPPWIFTVAGIAVILFLNIQFIADENENIFPRSRQKDGGRAFLDFLRLKQYKITESYDTLADALPRMRHRNRYTGKPQMLFLPQRYGASPLRISEIEPLLDFLREGNSVVVVTRNPNQFLSRLTFQFAQENSAEDHYLSRKNPAVQMSQTIRQLLQEFESENKFSAAEGRVSSQRTMESLPAVCRGEQYSRPVYLLAAEAEYIVAEPSGNDLQQTAYCTSEERLLALTYRAFGGTLQFLSAGSLLQNRYIAESDNIHFLLDFLQPQLYTEILWSEFHNNIFVAPHLTGRLLTDWRGRLMLFIVVFLLQAAILYSLRMHQSSYRRQRERLSLRGLIYPAELLSRYRRRKLLKKISAQHKSL